MASFDVNSLFTTVPLMECVNLCCDLLLEILILFYDQIDNIAMGSPLGPFLASLCVHLNIYFLITVIFGLGLLFIFVVLMILFVFFAC